MHIAWRSLHSVIRFSPLRAVTLFAAPAILPLAAASGDCVIRDVEMVRELDLDACRPEPVSMLEKAAVLRSLPVERAVTQLGSGEERKLRAVDAVLGTHGRKGVYEVKVIAVPQAWTGLHGRAVLLISSPALRLLSSEELQALVAHEIGHEYVWQQYADARTRRDAKRLRELELVCDAIAIATLIRLEVPLQRLESATKKVFSYNRERFGEALNAGSYPSPRARKQLIKRMSVCCLGNRDSTPQFANEQVFVRLYNFADVGAQTLHDATQHATVVLATGGVTAVWQQGAADAKEAHTIDLSRRPAARAQNSAFRKEFVLIVVRGVPSGYLPGALGRAFPEALTGVNAMIFYDRIERLKQSDEIDTGTALGLAMAHEIGHVLLRSAAHSEAGIMKSPWTKADLQHAAARLGEFTALQRRAIRDPAWASKDRTE